MNEKYIFKEVDKEGKETLEAISKADYFNEWMYQSIKPFVKGKVLEIGSGIGNISKYLINDNYDIVLSDIRTNYVDMLRNQFKDNDVFVIDLVDKQFDLKYLSLFNSFDTIFALNVIEHIFDDKLAIFNAQKLLKQGGNLIILVPAYNSLYNQFDKELEHYRRYNKKSLTKLMSNNLNIIHSQYFNAFAIIGWFFSGRILNNKIIPANQMSLYNKFVPIFKLIDKLIFNKIGLSVIVVGRK